MTKPAQKQLGLAVLIAPIGALVLGAASYLAQRGGMQNNAGFDVIFGALWTFALVYGVGLQAIPLRDTLLWGAAFGFLGWLIGPVTIGSILSGQGAQWSVSGVDRQFPELCAYLIYGITLGILLPIAYRAYILRESIQQVRVNRGALIRGALAGLVVALIFVDPLPTIGLLPLPGMSPQATPRIVYMLLSIVLGVVIGAIIAQSQENGGVNLIRGFAYGFLWWFLAQLTLRPLVNGQTVAWTTGDARLVIGSLLSLMLYGASLALAYHFLTRLQATLFADEAGIEERGEGIGARNLRALGWGTAGSLLGGLVFTVIMFQVGALPTIANIVGSNSTFTGLVVHFIISIIIGMFYALLYGNQATSFGNAAGWGATYGLFWWVLGPITLLPLLLGQSGALTLGAAVAAYPGSFIGHIAYGVVTAVYIYAVERRYRDDQSPRPAQTTGAQSALWLLVGTFVVIIPVLLH
jgi:uncharacterized membrane protein YagU involved in acid resistance